ncbi:TSUP family transporter [Streptomyces sp. NPDC101175]|uniref:TSUP family transporter n=1 Tax=Streptomyces sp. NPDC101175 TaxID=3366123 RepID=UPI0038332678
MTGDILLAAIVLLGSSVQWLTGMGFALVAVPALVLLLGPAQGVVLANCAAGAISVVGLAGGRRRVRARAMVPLCAAAVCTVPAGAWMTRQLPTPVLLLVMGGLVTAAVLLVMKGARVPALRGTRGAVAAGGFMNAAAGVAAMLVGGATGRALAGRTPEPRARALVLTLALAGGVTAVGKGVWGMWGP